jgi:hypothetical protein
MPLNWRPQPSGSQLSGVTKVAFRDIDRISPATRDETQNSQHLLRLGRLALLEQPK